MTVGVARDLEDYRPQGRADIVRRGTSNETLLYDPRADAVHVLNATALAVWDLCDGKHTTQEIEGALRQRFAVQGDSDIAGDVGRILDRFRREQLVEASPGDR